MCFSFIFVIPQKKAEASTTIAVSGVAVSATALYVLGALAVGGLATAIGIEYGDEINTHARTVWGTASNTVKTGFQNALTSAQNGVVTLTGTTKTWFQSAVNTVATSVYSGKLASGSYSWNFAPTTNETMPIIRSSSRSFYLIRERMYTLPTGAVYHVNTPTQVITGNRIEISIHENGNLTAYLYSGTSGTDRVSIAPLVSGSAIASNLVDYGGLTYATAFLNVLSNDKTSEALLSLLNSFGPYKIQVTTQAAVNAMYTDIAMGMGAIFGTGSLGINLPSDDLYLPKTATGQPLTRQTDGTLTLPTGDVYTGDLTYDLPGVIVLDLNGVRVPVIPLLDAPGYYVNVRTGEVLTIDGDIPIDTPFPPAIVVPPAAVPKPEKPTKTLNLMPLQMAGETLKSKFPFSIPFDFIEQFAVFDVSPQTPKIDIKRSDFVNIGGKSMSLDFSIDFAMFDDLATVTRWALLIVFDIGLILMIRRLMPE